MIRIRSALLLLFTAFSLAVCPAGVAATAGSLKAAPLFRDHAVLQQNKPVPVWGRAVPGTKVDVEFKGALTSTTADESGRWEVKLPAMPACADPSDLTIKTADETLVIRDVLVGEVWLCSGQSNMQFKLSQIDNVEETTATAGLPLIRNFREPLIASTEPQSDLPSGSWSVCTPSSSKNFSAVAFFFARDLYQTLNVPIGLIDSSWPGKMIEVFMSQDAVTDSGLSDTINQRWMSEVKTQPNPKIYNAHRPGCVFDGMVNPTLPYAVRGVIWYQGEQNTPRSAEYHALFPAMIRDWRAKFQQGDIPFYYVQLANYAAPMDSTGISYALLREAQTETLSVTNTGMAVAIDIGCSTNIHPHNKQDVGIRLAQIAKAKTYGVNCEWSGPVFRKAEQEGKALRVYFDHAGKDLTAKDPSVPGFEIAGPDAVFYPARVQLQKDSVLISSEKVPDPVSVRYAWGNDPQAGLYNDSLLPAVPFRFSLNAGSP